ncbi:DUF4339 domain-containing protein [Anatilimnocola floriformis]|uniref:DUF4339 domain-containing protein n=1 Tax=Anatilimnocola floriformis TaxID=2948575 RepID=UPI0020C3BB25|nr:DUF4339 domain-containing protein [Anatilimnocola floriformis]
MGIRFHCPNGHKLNVKSFLAGKKGVCPDCGVKLRIPERSEPGLGSDGDDDKDAPTEPAPTSPTAVVQAVHPQSAYTQKPVLPGYPSQQAPGPMPQFVPPAPSMPPPPPGLAGDPIAENPLATWFVRPPSGGQFGPARGDVMRKWLAEGRVTSDSLVWREGWVDWLAATEVFPSLGKPAAAAAPVFSVQTNTAPKYSSPHIPAGHSRSKNNSTTVTILVVLVMVCLVLGVFLALIISGQLSLSGETPSP